MIIFTQDCPFYCGYCSNSKFLPQNKEVYDDNKKVSLDYIKNEITRTKDFIDGVVLSGGEPLYQELRIIVEIAKYTKEAKLLFGIQTNGIEPDKIKFLANSKLLDAIFLDVKAPLREDKYLKIIGNEAKKKINIYLNSISKSIDICSELRKRSILKYFEVRTTAFKDISDTIEDTEEIISLIDYCDAYVIQQGRPEIAFTENFKSKELISRNELLKLAKEALKIKPKGIKTIKVRTHTFGDEIVK